MSKVCTNCGHELKNNAKYCPKCGAPVQSNTENQSKKRTLINFLKELTPEQQWQAKLFIKVYLPILVLIGGVIMFLNPYTFLYAVFPLIIGLIFTINGFRGMHISFEKCHSWRSLEKISQQAKGSSKFTRRETVTTKHYRGRIPTWNHQTGVSETEVDVPYQRIHYDCVYKCRNCGEIYNKEEHRDIRL